MGDTRHTIWFSAGWLLLAYQVAERRCEGALREPIMKSLAEPERFSSSACYVFLHGDEVDALAHALILELAEMTNPSVVQDMESRVRRQALVSALGQLSKLPGYEDGGWR
jgi:hypothetical protein